MTSVLYLATRFFDRFIQFLRDWYVGGFSVSAHKCLNILERLDRYFALEVNFRHIFEPLYQDRSVIGYILGFIFRTIRIILAFVVYAVIVFLFVAVYAMWAAIPFLLIYSIFTNHAIA